MRFRFVLAIALISVATGILVGISIGPPRHILEKMGVESKEGEGLISRMLPKEELPVFIPPTEDVKIADFETQKELQMWKLQGTSLKHSEEHVTSGSYSAEIDYEGGKGSKNFILREYFRSGQQSQDWRGFRWLLFDVFNPGDGRERFILQIKDEDGRVYKEEFYPEANQAEELRVALEDMKGLLNISEITRLNLFRWQPQNDSKLFIDNIRIEIGKDPIDTTEQAAKIFGATKTSLKKESQSFSALSLGESEDTPRIGVQSSLIKVFRDPNLFEGKWNVTAPITAARGESESIQILLQAGSTPLKDVEVEVSSMVTVKGSMEIIPRENINLYLVDYVTTTKPDYPVTFVGDWPDPLLPVKPFDLDKKQLQTVWVTVEVPRDIPGGEYRGEIKFTANNDEMTLPLVLYVWDFELPVTPSLKTAFDFYINRLESGYRDFLPKSWELWQANLEVLADKYYMMMLDYKMSPILNIDPLSKNFEYKMRKYSAYGMSSVAIGQNGGSFDNRWPENLNEVSDTYAQYAQILKENNLMDKAYVYSYDEPVFGDPKVSDVTKAIHQASPELKNLICMQHMLNPDNNPSWFEDIDIVTIRNVTFKESHAKRLQEMGKEVWLYVSGPSPPYPTYVIDYPSIAYRVIPWMCWKYDIKGLLFWCVNYWKKNPWETTQNTGWGQNSNGILFYPGHNGPVPTLRAEVIRDGIEDYEYFVILKKALDEIEQQNIDVNLETLQAAKNLLVVNESVAYSMKTYGRSPKNLLAQRWLIAQAIEWAQFQLNNAVIH